MNYNFTNPKGKSLSLIIAFALVFASAGFNIPVSAQYKQSAENTQKADNMANGGDLIVERSYPLVGRYRSELVPQAVDPNAFYSNVTGFTGAGVLNGGATNIGGNTITQMVIDDLTFPRGVPVGVVQIRFAVLNNNATAVSVRPRVRFFADNAGAPGTFITGLTFNALSFAANTITTVTSAPFAAINLTTTTSWVGMTFDNNLGATGATATQLDNFGHGSFTPIDRGSSNDSAFRTTAAGDFFNVSNPPGASFNTPTVVDTYGWELIAAPSTAAEVNISGRVMNIKGNGIVKTTVSLTDSNGALRTTITNALGYYSFENVPVGSTYIFSVENRGYIFSQPQQVLFIDGDREEINFVGQSIKSGR